MTNVGSVVGVVATVTIILPSYFGYRWGMSSYEGSVVALLTIIALLVTANGVGVFDD